MSTLVEELQLMEMTRLTSSSKSSNVAGIGTKSLTIPSYGI
jgi:hypothetical protein